VRRDHAALLERLRLLASEMDGHWAGVRVLAGRLHKVMEGVWTAVDRDACRRTKKKRLLASLSALHVFCLFILKINK
jgi:hypothetical protein